MYSGSPLNSQGDVFFLLVRLEYYYISFEAQNHAIVALKWDIIVLEV